MTKNLPCFLLSFFACMTTIHLNARPENYRHSVIHENGNSPVYALSVLSIMAPAAITVSTDYWSNTATQVNLGTPLVNAQPGTSFSVFNTAPLSFPIGVTEVIWTVADNLGNSATSIQKVTVKDLQNPFINHMGDISVVNDAGKCGAIVPLMIPYAYDNSGLPVTITNNAPVFFEVGSHQIIWTATDAFGNSDTSTQMITVIDNEKPQISVSAALLSNDPGKCGASVWPVPVTSDNCGITNLTNNAPAILPIGTTLVTWTVTDKNGYQNSAVQSVTVKDTEKPKIQAPANVVITTNSSKVSRLNLGNPNVSDNCGIQLVSNNAPRSYNRGTTTITWTVTDIHGNIATAQQSVTVQTAVASKSKKSNVTGSSQSLLTKEGIVMDNGTGSLSIIVGPNPSKYMFTLQVQSTHSGDINLQVIDNLGRTIDTHSRIQPGATLKIGDTYPTGIIYAIFRQGTENKVIQLIKVK